MTHHLVHLALAGVLSVSMATVTLSGRPEPFMQRVSPPDFLHLETVNELALSRSCELVIYQTEHGRILEALTIRPDKGDYVVGRRRGALASESGPTEKSESKLPASIAKRVLETFKLMLEYNVIAPAGLQKDTADGWGHNRWILLRVTPTQAIAGMVPGHIMHRPITDDASTFRTLLSMLAELREQGPEESERMLKELDVFTGKFIGRAKSAAQKR